MQNGTKFPSLKYNKIEWCKNVSRPVALGTKRMSGFRHSCSFFCSTVHASPLCALAERPVNFVDCTQVIINYNPFGVSALFSWPHKLKKTLRIRAHLLIVGNKIAHTHTHTSRKMQENALLTLFPKVFSTGFYLQQRTKVKQRSKGKKNETIF